MTGGIAAVPFQLMVAGIEHGIVPLADGASQGVVDLDGDGTGLGHAVSDQGGAIEGVGESDGTQRLFIIEPRIIRLTDISRDKESDVRPFRLGQIVGQTASDLVKDGLIQRHIVEEDGMPGTAILVFDQVGEVGGGSSPAQDGRGGVVGIPLNPESFLGEAVAQVGDDGG